jgi:hypothetical protein
MLYVAQISLVDVFTISASLTGLKSKLVNHAAQSQKIICSDDLLVVLLGLRNVPPTLPHLFCSSQSHFVFESRKFLHLLVDAVLPDLQTSFKDGSNEPCFEVANVDVMCFKALKRFANQVPVHHIWFGSRI